METNLINTKKKLKGKMLALQLLAIAIPFVNLLVIWYLVIQGINFGLFGHSQITFTLLLGSVIFSMIILGLWIVLWKSLIPQIKINYQALLEANLDGSLKNGDQDLFKVFDKIMLWVPIVFITLCILYLSVWFVSKDVISSWKTIFLSVSSLINFIIAIMVLVSIAQISKKVNTIS